MGVDPSLPEQQDLLERERRNKAKNEAQIDQKHIKDINQHKEKIAECIEAVQTQTARELQKQRDQIWSSLDRKLEEIKNQLKAENDRK